MQTCITQWERLQIFPEAQRIPCPRSGLLLRRPRWLDRLSRSQREPQFRDLLHRRGEPLFVAFDLLRTDGEDLRYTPLLERKAKLRALVPKRNDHLLYCDYIETHGDKLFALACKKDLGGIVAKRKYDPYIVGEAQWMKIRNTAYSQWEGREKLFEPEREIDPDIYLWDACVAACEGT